MFPAPGLSFASSASFASYATVGFLASSGFRSGIIGRSQDFLRKPVEEWI
jgi:hypothetical protein